MIALKFRYSENEYCRAMRDYYLHSKKTKIDGLILIICLPILAFTWNQANDWLKILMTTVCGLFLLLIFAILFIVPRIHFKQNPKFRDEYMLKFSETGIEFKTDHLNTKLDWNYYNKVWASKEFYYLFYSKEMFSIIPKRAFKTGAEEDEFREMARNNIAEIKTRI